MTEKFKRKYFYWQYDSVNNIKLERRRNDYRRWKWDKQLKFKFWSELFFLLFKANDLRKVMNQSHLHSTPSMGKY